MDVQIGVFFCTYTEFQFHELLHFFHRLQTTMVVEEN